MLVAGRPPDVRCEVADRFPLRQGRDGAVPTRAKRVMPVEGTRLLCGGETGLNEGVNNGHGVPFQGWEWGGGCRPVGVSGTRPRAECSPPPCR